MFKTWIFIGVMILSSCVAGYEIYRNHEIVDLKKKNLELQSDLLAAQESEKVRVVQKTVYLAAKDGQANVQSIETKCTNEPELVAAWADGIKRVRSATSKDGGS